MVIQLSCNYSFTLIKTNLCKWCDHSSPVCEDNVCMSNCSLTSYCTLAEEVCVAIWKKDNVSVSVRTLCYNPQDMLENIMLANYSSKECLMTPQHSEDGLLFICGCIGDHECNDRLIFDKGVNGSKDVIPVVVISLVPPLLIAVIATMAFYLYRTRQPRKKPKDWVNGSNYRGKLPSLSNGVNSEISSTCANNLNHNTEQLPIQLEALVGKGRFAEVWRARLSHNEGGQYETVAVKIFSAVEYSSWCNERAIFSDANLKHENIVQFLTAEERGGTAAAPQRQYWLIMAYYNMGNLQDFLTGHILTWIELCSLAGSVARGLAHLHSDTTPCGTPKVCEQPCIDSMRDLVLRDRGRPDIPASWTAHPGMQLVCATITECWDHDPEARLTAHCVVERFNTLAQEELENSICTHTPILPSTEDPSPSLPSLTHCTDHSTGIHPYFTSDTQISVSSRQPSQM
uniref:TGF-beta receptor type-2 n=1 Tax=Sinocyclocheilus grahami TaxID=75366 RepID=A0A672N0H9_SINGR